MAHELQVKSVDLVYFPFLEVVNQLLVQVLVIFLVALYPLGDLVAHILESLVGDLFLLLLILVLFLFLLSELQL